MRRICFPTWIALLMVACKPVDIPPPCEGVECLNGGECRYGLCLCPDGFEGDSCEILMPPSGFDPGDHLPDEVLIPRIWPGEDRGRLDVNQLLYRTRHDLLAVGVDGLQILSRARGGRATAFLLAPGAQVNVI